MAILTKKVQPVNALMQNQPWHAEEDGDICYSSPQKPIAVAIPSPTKEIRLSGGEVTIVDEADYEWLNQHKWWCAKRENIEYAEGRVPGDDGKRRMCLIHRLIMNTPPGMDTDHINGNGLDNRRSNLRIASHRENLRNRHKHIPGYKGVHYRPDRKVYHAYIQMDRRDNLGHFVSEIAAACAYDYAAKEYYGEFANLNFPDGQPLTMAEVERSRYQRSKTSAYIGVSWFKTKAKWVAKIMVDYKSISLGYFLEERDAAEAYNNAAIRLHGEKAKLNVFDELDMMAADLDALQLGLVEPMVRLTAAQLDELEEERIGADFSNNPYMY